MDEREEQIRDVKDRLARRRAWLDQLEKRYEDQYPTMPPRINQMRMEDLAAWRFGIEIVEWELEEFIKEEEEEE